MFSNNGTAMDWQGSFATVQERNRHLLETELNADVGFLAGTGKQLEDGTEEKQLIKAHKFILVNGSSIFAIQFNFDGSTFSGQDKNAPIEVKDISASAFNAMLRFLYTNDISLINGENFVDVCRAADRYLLYAFMDMCIEMAGTMLNNSNVFHMPRNLDKHGMTERCWEFIDQEISNFDDQVIMALSKEEMGELLERDTLRCEEFKLLDYLDKWAVKQCETDENIHEPTGEQLRAKMGPLLNAIRFPLIEPMDFIEFIVPKGILNNSEVAAMLLNYSVNMKNYQFSANPRAIPPRPHNKLMDKFVAEGEKAAMVEEIIQLRTSNARLQGAEYF